MEREGVGDAWREVEWWEGDVRGDVEGGIVRIA